MMKYAFGLALGLSLGASGAMAQSGGDYGRPLDTPQNRADGALRGAAYCSISRAGASARKVFTTQIASSDEAKRVKALKGVGRECFDNAWPDFNPTSFRNALAEIEYLSHYRTSDPRATLAFSKPLPPTFAVVPANTPGKPEQQVAWQLAAIARCTVFVAPEQSRKLILGPRNVAEEAKRFEALQPGIEQCVDTQAAKLLVPRNFRGFVADALLTRATAR